MASKRGALPRAAGRRHQQRPRQGLGGVARVLALRRARDICPVDLRPVFAGRAEPADRDRPAAAPRHLIQGGRKRKFAITLASICGNSDQRLPRYGGSCTLLVKPSKSGENRRSTPRIRVVTNSGCAQTVCASAGRLLLYVHLLAILASMRKRRQLCTDLKKWPSGLV